MRVHSMQPAQAQRPPSDRRADMLFTAVMPHSPSDIVLWPTDLTKVPEFRKALGDWPIAGAQAAPPRAGLERVACHSERQDTPQIETEVDRLRVLLQYRCPVTHLPPELLVYIFDLYVTRLGESTPGDVRIRGPTCLAQVCTLWKAIVESDPRLWTNIYFLFPESHENGEEDVPRVKLVLDAHLKRSGTLPISLTFTDHRMYDAAREDLVSFLVDRLRTHGRRWKHISLQLAGDYFRHLFAFTPCDLSSLEHLHINSNTAVVSGRRTIVDLQLDVQSATNLKSFTYNGPGSWDGDAIHLCWESLEEISLEFVPHYGASHTLIWQFKHLAQCQNVTTFSLGIHRNARLNGSQSITLPCLQTLRVRRVSPYGHARFVIDLLVLPQLKTLEIDASILVCWNQIWHDGNFSSLLARSGCTLHHLSVQDVDFPDDELLRCLTLSPALESLRFIPCPRSQDISYLIREMNVQRTPMDTQGHMQGHVSNVAPPVPLLQEITLASSVEEYLDLMMGMFRSRVGLCARAAGVASLQRVQVMFFDMWHKNTVDRVRRPGHRLRNVTTLRETLAEWAAENRNGNGNEDQGGKILEASVVVDTPYFPEYINIE